jgi:5-methylthioadenosine/S-adenosylhomocysteine deaminase
VKKAHELAASYGVPFQIHAVEAPQENEQMMKKLGQRTIPALYDAGVLAPGTILHHAIWLDANDIALIARSGASTSHNPESNMKLASGVAKVPELLAAGVPVGLGTDGAASNNNLDMLEEMDSAAKLQKISRMDPTALPATTVFEMATLGGARALGLADRLGSLEVGKLADVVLVDVNSPELTPMYHVYSQLVYAAEAGNVSTVIVNGKIIVRDREVTTVDTETILEKARELKKKIWESLPASSR